MHKPSPFIFFGFFKQTTHHAKNAAILKNPTPALPSSNNRMGGEPVRGILARFNPPPAISAITTQRTLRAWKDGRGWAGGGWEGRCILLRKDPGRFQEGSGKVQGRNLEGCQEHFFLDWTQEVTRSASGKGSGKVSKEFLRRFLGRFD